MWNRRIEDCSIETSTHATPQPLSNTTLLKEAAFRHSLGEFEW